MRITSSTSASIALSSLTMAFALAFTVFRQPAQAQEAPVISDEELRPALEAANQGISQIVNSLTLFASQDAVSSGYFKFKSDTPGGNDTKVTVLKIPGRYSFGLEEKTPIRPFIHGQLGALKVTTSLDRDDTSEGRDDFFTLNLFTVEGGGGVDLAPVEGLVVTPEVSVAYSRLNNDYDYNNQFSQQLVRPLFDRRIFNWDLDVVTYTPRMKAAYSVPINDATLTVTSRYSYLYNHSFDSSTDDISVSSSTKLWQNGIEMTVPLCVEVANSPISVRPYFIRSDVYGTARDGLGFGHFYEGGADLILGTKKSVGILSEISLGTSYTFADDFHGWRAGFGYKF